MPRWTTEITTSPPIPNHSSISLTWSPSPAENFRFRYPKKKINVSWHRIMSSEISLVFKGANSLPSYLTIPHPIHRFSTLTHTVMFNGHNSKRIKNIRPSAAFTIKSESFLTIVQGYGPRGVAKEGWKGQTAELNNAKGLEVRISSQRDWQHSSLMSNRMSRFSGGTALFLLTLTPSSTKGRHTLILHTYTPLLPPSPRWVIEFWLKNFSKLNQTSFISRFLKWFIQIKRHAFLSLFPCSF